MCIAQRWIGSSVDVVRVTEWIMYVNLMIGKQLVNIDSAYASEVGLNAREDYFWDSLIIVLPGIPLEAR